MSAGGRSFALVDEKNHGYRAPATFTTDAWGLLVVLEPPAGDYTAVPGILSYFEICHNVRSNGWTEVWLDEGKVPYAHGDGDWIGYDNADSIIYKFDIARSYGVGGIWWWGIDGDDFKVRFKLWTSNERFGLKSDVYFEFNWSKQLRIDGHVMD